MFAFKKRKKKIAKIVWGNGKTIQCVRVTENDRVK